MTEFEGVAETLGQALTKRGYTHLTPVQEAMLRPDLLDSDALVSAQTGSGKTVAFGMALARTLLNDNGRFAFAQAPLALAVAPTRELALQVKRELEWLFEMTGATVASCVGGMDMRTERRVLERGAHMVVGTPGRLRDHIERGSLDTAGLRAVVLDEADEMLDLGFRDDLEYILDAAPAERRTLMFSATVPRSIANLAKRYQRDAVRVSTVAEQSQHLDIDYRALTVAPNDRENAIINLLRFYDAKNALVFCSTRATVNHMTSRFANRGFSVVALSGELSQNERSHALQAMRDARARVCIATDVAARGIDLPGLELVIHADLPKNREGLLHRSGRTGRAGRKGVSALIVPHNWRSRTERMLRAANIEATWANPPSVEDIQARDRERILADPMLTEALSEDEQAFAQELLDQHSPEQVAAAFLRLRRAEQPAPEELLNTAPVERPKRQRDDFKNGVWISLSVGREHTAEPRWLLPMLCRAGHVTKHEIGAIRIHAKETHVELAPDSIERFMEALGPGQKVEKTISVTRLEGIPEPPKDAGPRKPYARKKPYADKKPYEGPKTDAHTPPEKPKAKPVEAPAKPSPKPKPNPKSNSWSKKIVDQADKPVEKPKRDPWKKKPERAAKPERPTKTAPKAKQAQAETDARPTVRGVPQPGSRPKLGLNFKGGEAKSDGPGGKPRTKPKSKAKGKPKGKKDFKPKFPKGGRKQRTQDDPGSRPLMRKRVAKKGG
ncbi:DEAD/DEAH box helicase [Magnetospira sp. QH-2]|uniref:DEAD/DEAH box helicase n=1 Tax=Magnetospira sp. (strain QH-2) TaxID=1288970 RepID=UPI0003E81967|nr:DEAD/DEAH box helicase [Magnetospira sp. QH-2]CCQ73023.1 Putative cold shock protein, DEAD-box ATP-dependent RNA helicase [Magnetospira sp. QH-2]